MKCLFIYFSIDATEMYLHSIGTLSAIARDVGFEVDLLCIKSNAHKENASLIIARSPDIVAFTVPSMYWNSARVLAFENKSWLQKGMSSYRINIIDSLADTPMPDLRLYSKDVILEYPSLYFSKGCVFSCNYCMSRNGGYAGKVRWKSPERAILECVQLRDYCAPTELYFDDDTFIKDMSWASTFLELYKKKVGIPFYCNSRPELLTDQSCTLLKESLCKGIGIGIESGSERIRRTILGRQVSNQKILEAFDLCKRNHIETWSFNMVNIPTETVSELEETIAINRMASPTYVRISTFTPFPGSPLYEKRDEYHSYFSSEYDILIPSEKKRAIVLAWINELRMEGKLWND